MYKMYKISYEVIKFIEKTRENWKVESTAGGKSFAEVKIQREIFQRDALITITICYNDDATQSHIKEI